MITKDEVLRALSEVRDPELKRSLTELGMVDKVEVDGSTVRVTVALTTRACPLQDHIAEDVRAKLKTLPGVERVEVDMSEMSKEKRDELFGRTLNAPIASPESKTRIIGVASGKGGVGKSTVTVNLGAALHLLGFDVAILDCDIYGFSVPRMVGVEGRRPVVVDGKIIPIPAHGMKVISMGNFVDDNTPVVWRGPMLGKILRQFLTDVVWGEPDFLLLDLPPGTGDMALDVAQLLPKAALLIVTTPQVVASNVAVRAAQMAFKTNQELIGVVENMSAFICPCCGEATPIFGEGGGRAVAEALGVPLLGSIPLTMEARTHGDQGVPVALAEGSPSQVAYLELAERVAQALGVSVKNSARGSGA